jgi:hypothetical protein
MSAISESPMELIQRNPTSEKQHLQKMLQAIFVAIIFVTDFIIFIAVHYMFTLTVQTANKTRRTWKEKAIKSFILASVRPLIPNITKIHFIHFRTLTHKLSKN